MFEGMDDTTQLSIEDIKEMLLKHENDKNKEKPELLDRVALLEARLEGLGVDVSREASIGSPSGPLNRVPHVYPKNNSTMPHINNCGPAPHFDGTHFSHWKSSMESHFHNCSVELWEIIVEGLKKPHEPNNLSPREFYDRQLNASACDKIRSAIHRKLLDQVIDIESAKELWDRIVVLQEGTNLIQKSFYETAKTEANMFMINDGETLFDSYAIL